MLAEADYSFQENKWHSLQVIGDGSSITCKINTDPYYIEPDDPGQVLFTVTDDSLTEGRCGYWATDDTQQYTNFAVSNTGTDITLEKVPEVPEHTHTLTEYPAKEATCTQEGHTTY